MLWKSSKLMPVMSLEVNSMAMSLVSLCPLTICCWITQRKKLRSWKTSTPGGHSDSWGVPHFNAWPCCWYLGSHKNRADFQQENRVPVLSKLHSQLRFNPSDPESQMMHGSIFDMPCQDTLLQTVMAKQEPQIMDTHIHTTCINIQAWTVRESARVQQQSQRWPNGI